MGMFDSVIARCPACGEEVEFQSKAGVCEISRIKAQHRELREFLTVSLNTGLSLVGKDRARKLIDECEK